MHSESRLSLYKCVFCQIVQQCLSNVKLVYASIFQQTTPITTSSLLVNILFSFLFRRTSANAGPPLSKIMHRVPTWGSTQDSPQSQLKCKDGRAWDSCLRDHNYPVLVSMTRKREAVVFIVVISNDSQSEPSKLMTLFEVGMLWYAS